MSVARADRIAPAVDSAGTLATDSIVPMRRSAGLFIAVAVQADGTDFHYQAGGGIVADSDPAAEYDETLAKAAAMARALGATLP